MYQISVWVMNEVEIFCKFYKHWFRECVFSSHISSSTLQTRASIDKSQTWTMNFLRLRYQKLHILFPFVRGSSDETLRGKFVVFCSSLACPLPMTVTPHMQRGINKTKRKINFLEEKLLTVLPKLCASPDPLYALRHPSLLTSWKSV